MNELAILRSIQSLASPFLDVVFIAITSLGSEEFYTLCIAAIYWCVDREMGFQLGILVMLSFWVNCIVKDSVATARPTPDQVRVIYAASAEGYAFPSAHAQGALTFWGGLVVSTKRKNLLIAACIVVPLIAFSRLYLGVHWPTDIIGGIAFGFLMLGLWPLILAVAAGTSKHLSMASQVLACLVIPALIVSLDPNPAHAKVAGFVAGFVPASMFERWHIRFSATGAFRENVKKVLLGGTIVMAVRFGLKLLFPETVLLTYVRYVMVALTGGLIAPYLFVRTGISATLKA